MFLLQPNFFYNAGMHLGGSKSSNVTINNFNSNLFYGKRKSFYVFNYKFFIYNLRISLFFLYRLISLRGKVLAFDDRFEIRRCLLFFLNRARQYYIVKNWVGGTLTNFKNFQVFFVQILKGSLSFKKYDDFFFYFYGMRNMYQLPSLVILSNPSASVVSLQESFRIGVPIMSLININTLNTNVLTFPIPGNNYDFKSVFVFYSIIGDCLLFSLFKPVSLFFIKFFKRLKLFRKFFFFEISNFFFPLKKNWLVFKNVLKKQHNNIFLSFFYYLNKTKLLKNKKIFNNYIILKKKRFNNKFFLNSFILSWFIKKVLKKKKVKKSFKRIFRYKTKKKKLKIIKLIFKKSILFLKKKIASRIKSFILFRNKTKIEQKYLGLKNHYKELGFKIIQNNADFENEKLEEVLEEYDELPDERKKKFLKKLSETLEKMPSSIVFVKDFLNIEEEINLLKDKKIIFNLDEFLTKKKISFIDNYNFKAWSKYNRINKSINFIISNKIKFLFEKKIKKNQNDLFIKNYFQFKLIKKKKLLKIKFLYKFKSLDQDFQNIINWILKSSLIKFFYRRQLFKRRNNIKFYREIYLSKNIFIKKLFYDKKI